MKWSDSLFKKRIKYVFPSKVSTIGASFNIRAIRNVIAIS